MSEQELLCDISEISICNELQVYIDEVYPKFSDCGYIEDKAEMIAKSEDICKDLHGIYFERERYDLHWAFKKAQESVIVRQEKVGKKLREKIPNYKEILSNTSRRTKLKVKRMRNTFNTYQY